MSTDRGLRSSEPEPSKQLRLLISRGGVHRPAGAESGRAVPPDKRGTEGKGSRGGN